MRSIVCKLALAAATVTALFAPAVAQAGTPIEEGVKYLEKVQKSEKATGVPSFGGDWALTSLAAGGKAAADVHRGTGTVFAREWYEGYIAPSTWPGEVENPATDFEKAALVSYAAGIDPARVSIERNLLANIISEYQATPHVGYYGKPSIFEGTIFGVLALADTKTTTGVQRIPAALLKQSDEVIVNNEHTDGGWNYNQAEGNTEVRESASEPDTTGAAIAALCTSGVKTEGIEHALSKGEEYLKKILEANGAFEGPFGINADSNAWAVQGLNACSINAKEFKKAVGDESPVQFLESLQIKSGENKGGFLYEAKGSVDNYSSQDAVRAIAGAGFTAAPPTPKREKQLQWNFATKFSTTKSSPLALIINNGTTLKVCSVAVKAATATEESGIGLLKILEAAKAGGSGVKPAGCVSSYEPTSGSGAITSINGTAAAWKLSLNGSSEVEAKLGALVELGAVIYLNA
ncbi:MAG TPA: hypothetical protein VGL37_03590 [Solirubrobacteraceae bacterium]|jgi:hypothetical protein